MVLRRSAAASDVEVETHRTTLLPLTLKYCKGDCHTTQFKQVIANGLNGSNKREMKDTNLSELEVDEESNGKCKEHMLRVRLYNA